MEAPGGMMRPNLAIALLRREIKNGERALRQLEKYKPLNEREEVAVKVDRAMWEALVPDMRVALEILEGPKRVMHLEDL